MIHDDYKKIEYSYTPAWEIKDKIVTLANCIVSEAVKDSPTLRKVLRANKNLDRIGVLIANHHGIHHGQNEYDDQVPEMSVLVPKWVAFKYHVSGCIAAPAMAGGGDMSALQRAYWLI